MVAEENQTDGAGKEEAAPEGTSDEAQERPGRVKLVELPTEYVDISAELERSLIELDEQVSQMEERVGELEQQQEEVSTATTWRLGWLHEMAVSLSLRLADLQEAASGERLSPLRFEREDASRVPQAFAQDKAHQAAWRRARMLVTELAVLNPARLRKGIRAGRFREEIGEQIAEAQRRYRQSVSNDVLTQYDYFASELDALIERMQEKMAGELDRRDV